MSLINKNKAYTYFSNEFNITKSTKGWYAFSCPFCTDLRTRKKAAVQFKYGVVKCWICGYKRPIMDFIMDYEDVGYFAAKEIIEACAETSIDFAPVSNLGRVQYRDVELPKGYTSVSDYKGTLGLRAFNYLISRGFDIEEMDRIGLGYCAEQAEDKDENFFGYIIIPFKRQGKLLYYIGRDFIGNFLRYKNPPKDLFNIGKGDLVFNEDALNLYDECYILEGWADAVTLGRAATSTQGWSLSPSQMKIYIESSCDSLTLIPDAGADNTGDLFYHKALRTASDLLNYKKEVRVLDLNEIATNGKDVNEIGKEAVMKLREQTEPLTFEDITLKLLL